MLSDEDFVRWCERLKLTPGAIKVIENIRSSPPARRVRSGPFNVSEIFNQSLKMPHSIQSESRTVESCAILLKENDADVLENWDQPPSFTINYKGSNGRTLGHLYTADFFVLRRNGAGWEEWKPEEALYRLARKSPNRYLLGSDGKWRCPPCEEYASQFGLYFEVHSSAEINWILLRNYNLLLPILRAEFGKARPDVSDSPQ